jgi:hypothetical protein
MSEANSELLLLLPLLFSQSHKRMIQKTAPRIERKRDSIEFERSENQGQFFIPNAFNDFNAFNAFRDAVSLYLQMF